jgi:hypothetical protein
MKIKLRSFIILFLSVLLFASPSFAKPTINIGIVLDGPWGRMQENTWQIFRLFRPQLVQLRMSGYGN